MSPTAATLHWHPYRYFPYEKELAQREVETLLRASEVHPMDGGVQILGQFSEDSLRRLVYFGRYDVGDGPQHTLQYDLEQSCATNGQQKRQSTRYSVHGLHEYKGKFNPQVVRGVLHLLGADANSHIVDPFCGSGTSLVECAHAGMRAAGFDLNPLAVYIANTKLKALGTSHSALRVHFVSLLNTLEKGIWPKPPLSAVEDARARYLSKWFDEDRLSQFEELKAAIQESTADDSDVFLVLASDLIRDYSLQEPNDLRIRRRYSPFPTLTIREAFERKAGQFLDNLECVQAVIGVKKPQCQAYLADSRVPIGEHALPKPGGVYDAAITSPPYATALPYIDTQRLSLVWLDLISPSEISDLESKLTGSREFVRTQRKAWTEALRGNSESLPAGIQEYCMELDAAVSPKDGFRRQFVPALVYRYLTDMRNVFNSIAGLMDSGAPFALIVGHNRTILGGKQFDVDTPALLREIALSCGWVHVDSISLQTYQRYGLHMANAVLAETLLIVRRS